MRLFSLFFAVWLLNGCTRIAVMKEITPVFQVGIAVPSIQSPSQAFREADKCARKSPLLAAEHYLGALQDLSRQLDRQPSDAAARQAYNFALDRVFSLIRAHDFHPWDRPLQVGRFTFAYHQGPRASWHPSSFEFLPADQVEIGGDYIKQRVERPGLGASLVAIGRTPRGDFRETLSQPRTYYGVSAVAEFQGNRCRISFVDPLDRETVQVGRHTYPLAADFTTPLAVLLTRERPEKLGLARLLDPDKYAETARLSRLRPYDDGRIPLLLVHGLLDTPATWFPLINSLRADPLLRRKYQIWVYSYPSGYPYPYAASLLRKELDRSKRIFPKQKPMVYVGHSMGGMIGRLMITDSQDKLWDAYFHAPPEKVRMSPREKQLMKDMLIFDARPEIARAIFICSPHRGADMADNWIGRLGRRLVRVPQTMLAIGDALTQAFTFSQGGQAYENLPTSIDTLTPRNTFVKTLDTLPIHPGIPYHSIMGDRGKARAANHPELGSDGFVPYLSSHLDGASSQLIIPSNHSGHQHPAGIAEVARLLREHLKSAR